MKDEFSRLHPIVNFIYFAAVITLGMFVMHPVFLAVSFVCSFLYSLQLKGKKALKFNLFGMLPLLIFAALINPAFNHAGITILFYLPNDNPVTMESLLYGLLSAVMLVSVIVWFSCFNAVMTSDKIIFLFGRLLPSLSLIFSMVLRFVPKFGVQFTQTANAQRAPGADAVRRTKKRRIQTGVHILSAMITWSLEDAIDTADSMKARGYGLPGRTSFSNYRFDRRDMTMTAVIAALFAVIATGMLSGHLFARYFPSIRIADMGFMGIAAALAFLALCLTPVAFNITEEIKWNYLQSKT